MHCILIVTVLSKEIFSSLLKNIHNILLAKISSRKTFVHPSLYWSYWRFDSRTALKTSWARMRNSAEINRLWKLSFSSRIWMEGIKNWVFLTAWFSTAIWGHCAGFCDFFGFFCDFLPWFQRKSSILLFRYKK